VCNDKLDKMGKNVVTAQGREKQKRYFQLAYLLGTCAFSRRASNESEPPSSNATPAGSGKVRHRNTACVDVLIDRAENVAADMSWRAWGDDRPNRQNPA
jgi:hypothetical protein